MYIVGREMNCVYALRLSLLCAIVKKLLIYAVSVSFRILDSLWVLRFRFTNVVATELTTFKNLANGPLTAVSSTIHIFTRNVILNYARALFFACKRENWIIFFFKYG